MHNSLLINTFLKELAGSTPLLIFVAMLVEKINAFDFEL
jgi:hypothetical protein